MPEQNCSVPDENCSLEQRLGCFLCCCLSTAAALDGFMVSRVFGLVEFLVATGSIVTLEGKN